MSDYSGNKRIAKNTIALYIRMGITMIIGFFTTRVTLEILGVEDYGLNNVVASIVSMFSFINGSMGTAVQRFFSIEIGRKNENNLTRVFGTGLYLHLIVAVITLIIAEVFALFFLHKLNIPPDRILAGQIVFQISIISLVINILNVPYAAFLRAKEEFSRIAVLDILQAFLRLGVLYLLYKINYDKLVTLSALNLGVTLFYATSIVLLSKRYKEVKLKIIRDKEYITKMFSFVTFLLFTVLASLVDKQGVVLLINLFFGLSVNAAYAIAFQVSLMLETFAMNFKQSVVPQLMQSYGANNINRMNSLMFLGTKITFLLMMLITIPIIFEVDYILNIWLKDPPTYTSFFIILMIISVNINVFSYFVYQGVHASGKIKEQQILTSASYLISIFVVLITFKLGGNFYYAGYIPILFSILRNIITVHSAKKTINFNSRNYFFQVVIRCIVSIIILISIYLCLINCIEMSFKRLFLGCIVNCVLVLVIGFHFIFNNSDRDIIRKSVLHKIKN